MKAIISTLIIFFSVGLSHPISGCSCIGQRLVEQEIKHVDAVIVGTILNKEIITLTDSALTKILNLDSTTRNLLMNILTIARYELFVQDFYKGRVTNDTVTIYTGIGGGDCGIDFEVGKKYIVYGENEAPYGDANYNSIFSSPNNIIWTNICLRTTYYTETEITEIEKFVKKKEVNKNQSFLNPFIEPEVPPTYKDGGTLGLIKFIEENLRYPNTGDGITGKIYVGFVVDTAGNVKDITIKKGVSLLLDEEAIRLVKMLTFIPGTIYGKLVETQMVLPINFTKN